MLFNSYIFCFLFFPAVFVVYFWLHKHRQLFGQLWLVLASLFFYGYWNLKFLPLIAGSILFNYTIGRLITGIGNRTCQDCDAERRLCRVRKGLLIAGITGDLILLGFYKYYDFFIDNINTIAGTQISQLQLVLPLGISFFTFTQIAYLVDSYQNKVAKQDLVNYSLFVSYFPHLLAGPIIHYKDMLPQFTDSSNKRIDWGNIAQGLVLFSIGLFKKVIIADTFAKWASPGFGADYLSMMEAWAAVLSYTFQIYFDFSGYTDMALGVSRMLNINLPQNFNSPYQANSIIDFWRRWHITLSNFLRDYLYIPLGGNRKGKFRRYLNLIITMLLGGLWHGASWTFVFWGALHGLALTINHLWRDFGFKMHWLVGRILTLGVVMAGWFFFRADSFQQAFIMFRGLLNWRDLGWTTAKPAIMPDGRVELIVLFAFLVLVSFQPDSTGWAARFKPNWKWAFAVGLLLLISILNFTRTSSFLYYQF